MDRYIGIDAHDKSCTLVVLNAKGHEIKHAVLETNGAVLRDYVRQVPPFRHIAIEEGALSGWLYELVESYAHEMVVFIPPKRDGPKSDLKDARDAAEGLRTGTLERTVYKPDRELAPLRNALRGYQLLRGDLTRAKVREKSVFRSRAVVVDDAIYRASTRIDELKKLEPPEAGLANVLGREVDSLNGLLDEQHALLRATAAKYPAVALLSTAPAIGLIRAATIVSVVGTPHRFRTRAQYWSYCGLGIVRRSSSDWTQKNGAWQRVNGHHTRGLNRNRNAWLKDVYKGAASGLIARSPDDPLVLAHRRRMQNGVAPSLSTLTLARQIAAITLSMWKHHQEYDPTRYPKPDKTTTD